MSTESSNPITYDLKMFNYMTKLFSSFGIIDLDSILSFNLW